MSNGRANGRSHACRPMKKTTQGLLRFCGNGLTYPTRDGNIYDPRETFIICLAGLSQGRLHHPLHEHPLQRRLADGLYRDRVSRNRPTELSITHKFRTNLKTYLHIGQTAHSTPHYEISWRRIICTGEVSTKSSDLNQAI